MADNVNVTEGSGKIIAADEISGVNFQRVKIIHGADGVNAGDVATGNPLPVVQTGTPALPTGAATAAAQSTGNASLASVDGKLPALGQAVAAASVPVILPAATITTLTPPAAISGFATSANQSTEIASLATLAGAVAGSEFQVDVLTLPNVTLAAGTNANEVVGDAAHDVAASGNPVAIGGVASAAAPTSVSADQDAVRAWFLRNGAQATVLTAAGALIGGDATNGLDVDVTRVSGTVTVDGSGVTQPVSLASVPSHAVTNAGTFAVQESGAALTALQLLDDAVYTDGTGTPSKALGVAGTDGTNPQILKTDAAGELQVDVLTMPTTTVTATNLDIRDIDAAADDITVFGNVGVLNQLDLTNSNPAAVAIVDGAGTQITSFGGGTQYTEGDTDASVTGTAMLWEDTSDTLRVPSAAKPLPVAIISGAGSGGTASQDGSVFTPDTTNLTPIGGYRDDGTPATVTEGDAAAARITEYRAIHVNLRDASGTEVAVGGGTQYDEDTASAAGEKLTMAGVVRADIAASLVGADGDRTELIVDATGRLHVNVGNTVTVASHAVTNVGTFAVQAAQSGTWNVTNVSGTVSLPTGAATAAKQDTEIASLATLAGAVAGTEMQVDVLTMPTVAVTGTFWQATQPVSGTVTVSSIASISTSVTPGTSAVHLGKAEDAEHASGDTGVMALAVRADTAAATGADGDYVPLLTDSTGKLHVNVGNTVTVASHAVTNAGTFAVQAAQNGTWNIATVSAVTAITDALPAGTNAIGKLAANSGVDIGDVDVTSCALPTGAATSALQSTGNTSLGTIAGAVSGTEMQVDVVTLPALAAGTNNIGDVDVLTLPALAAGTALIGKVSSGLDTSTIYNGTTALTPKFAAISTASSGISSVVAAVASKKIRVLSYRFQCDADVSVKFRDNTAGVDLTGAMASGAKGGGGGSAFSPVGHFETASGNALSINLSGAIQTSGHVCYIEV